MSNSKNFLVALFILLMLAGCAKKPADQKFDKTGAEGIIASFIAGQPPDKIYAEANSDNRFDVALEIRNKGAYPEPGRGSGINGLGTRFGIIFITGYDDKIIKLQPKENGKDDLSQLALEGKSPINPNGGQDITSFTGTIDYATLNVNI